MRPPIAGFSALGRLRRLKKLIPDPVEEADVGKPDQGAQHAEYPVEGELACGGEGKIGDVEDGGGPVVKGVDHKSNDGREDAGNEGLELEVLSPVKDLGREKAPHPEEP